MILRLLKFLKQVLRKIGDFQSRLILSLFYIVILSPFAAIMKIFHDPLAIRKGSKRGWTPRRNITDDTGVWAAQQY